MAFRGLIQTLIFRRQLHVISRSSSSIKPASPTPSKLKRYNIPLHDRTVQPVYVPLIFFYPNYNSDHSLKLIPNNASYLLKKSLSETLSKYYPFAGRLCSRSHVDCNDQGVNLVEAQIGCKLWEVLEKPPVMEQEEGLGHLFPPRTIWNKLSEMHSGIVMHVQLNHFTCGGIAIAVSLHHHLGDALTLCSFLRYWATLSLHSNDHQKLLHLCPHLVYELLPPSDDDGDSGNKLPIPDDKNWITKEVVFPNAKLRKLKAVMENEDKLNGVVEDQKYTRNEVLTALLYRCLVAAAAKTNTGADNGSVLIRLINVRSMMDPPLSETSVGNFVTINCIPTSTENETKIRTLVVQMKKEKRQLKGLINLDGQEVEPKLIEFSKQNYRFYSVTSMCNFPVYEAMDFGWGKPIKAVLVDNGIADIITLMDTANDGIRAVVSLGEQDMKNFLEQRELLDYASIN